MKSRIKLLIWLSIVAIAMLSMNWLNSRYSLDEMREAIVTYQWYFLSAYAIVIAFRGLLFIPTMPLILVMASAVEPWLLFIISLTMSCLSAYFVCLAIDHLDMKKRLSSIPGKSIKRAQAWVNSMGVAAIAAWAFFPLVFTEIIVYLARLSGLSRKQIVMSVAVGEGLLISLLIYVSDWISKLVL
ncbi:hypothetical protein DBZ36_05290 [Alginatibacterium sediminis]|uniref:TVP38/TMEM64 family protein n=1 Tax=Alginatibacterium sediminis TaxID=2164068 RepID=A0A420EGT4_9ALTE|nr:hypothetical protein [Alginatibacterium sediminis]RKF19874.1 hypothetical protein DBZ36_05290 [Alginatibacterium sediminis]